MEVSEIISPDAAVLIEDLLRHAGLRRPEFCTRWGVRCIGLLPLKDWDGALEWIADIARQRGVLLPSCTYPEIPAEAITTPEPHLQDKARQVMDNVGSKKAGGSMFDDEPPVHSSNPFADMADDIPY